MIEKQKEKKHFSPSKGLITAIKVIVIVLLLAAATAAVIWMLPWIPKLTDGEELAVLKAKLDSFAPFSWAVLLLVQILQVVIAVIPGEPIELLSGVFCGTLGGLALCLFGLLIGTVLDFYLVRWLGKGFIEKLFAKEEVSKFKLLRNTKNLEILVALLYFIPGTPKDLLTFLVPLTRMKPIRFFVISTVARIPSVITSSYAGAHLSNGDWKSALIMYAVVAVTGICGLVINRMWEKKRAQKEQAAENAGDNPDTLLPESESEGKKCNK